jgi:hypothetical protein
MKPISNFTTDKSNKFMSAKLVLTRDMSTDMIGQPIAVLLKLIIPKYKASSFPTLPATPTTTTIIVDVHSFTLIVCLFALMRLCGPLISTTEKG